jgi:hypothetical protein
VNAGDRPPVLEMRGIARPSRASSRSTGST